MVKNRIKELRTAKGLTQYQLAHKVGLTRRGLLFIEKHYSDVRISVALALAKELSVRVEDLFYM